MTKLQPPFRTLANPAQFERFIQEAGSPATRGERVSASHYDWHGRKIELDAPDGLMEPKSWASHQATETDIRQGDTVIWR